MFFLRFIINIWKFIFFYFNLPHKCQKYFFLFLYQKSPFARLRVNCLSFSPFFIFYFYHDNLRIFIFFLTRFCFILTWLHSFLKVLMHLFISVTWSLTDKIWWVHVDVQGTSRTLTMASNLASNKRVQFWSSSER